jgi:hypothetical protein
MAPSLLCSNIRRLLIQLETLVLATSAIGILATLMIVMSSFISSSPLNSVSL